MTESTLTPERQLVFSPSLAATIGLEEAILLQHLAAVFEHRAATMRGHRQWLTLERQWLLDTLPFWGALDLHRVSKSLADKGLILVESPPLHESDTLVFALNESNRGAPQTRTTPATHGEPPSGRRHGAGLLSASWAPSEEILQLLGMNQNIPRKFALDQLEDFVYYWRERGEISHAWDNKFRQHVINRWRTQQRQETPFIQPEAAVLNNDWRPSADAMEILLRAEIPRDFIDEAVPEFILYWRERGEPPRTLNSKFVTHIRQQWARVSSARQHDAIPAPIRTDWRPSSDVYDILQMSHIDRDFANQVLPEFIVYWRDDGRAHTSWNSKFLQHVKYHWAQRHQLTQADAHHEGQQGHPAVSTRSRSLADDLGDRSWAD